LRFRPSLWLTIFAAMAFAVLCGLGYWQLQRLDWKQGLIEQIAARMDQPARPLPQALADPTEWRFRRVELSGVFRHEGEVYRAGRPEDGEIGYRVFTPLVRESGRVVMIERGWVPGRFRDPAARPGEPPRGEVTVTGVLRLPDPDTIFTPGPDAASRTWFAVDPPAMAAVSGLDAPAWYVVAEGGGEWPRAERPDLNLRNTHLNYALTWFSLAAVLAVIWLIMGFRRGRERRR
jgi:surfeit locus 1 family protein